MSATQPITINDAKTIAMKRGYDQVIIVGRKVGEDGVEHVTTFGRDKEIGEDWTHEHLSSERSRHEEAQRQDSSETGD